MSCQRSIASPENDQLFCARSFATWRRASTNGSGVRPTSPRQPRRSWSTRVRSRSRPAPEARRNRVRRAPGCRSPVTVGHRMLLSVLARLDPGDEDFSDRFAPGVPDLEPIVLEDLVQSRHPAVDPVYVSLVFSARSTSTGPGSSGRASSIGTSSRPSPPVHR